MDCRESRDIMSEAVDNELHGSESQNFYEHIEICGSCRDEYELEKLTKAYIKRKITFVEVPYDLEQAIMAQLAGEGSAEQQDGFIARLMSNNLFQPVLAVGFIFVIAIALFFANKSDLVMPTTADRNPSAIQSGSEDALSLAMNNFQKILNGEFKPQVTAITVPDVATYIQQNAGYPMPLPTVANADWIGGSVTEFSGNKMAQVIYKMGEQYIYICSFPIQQGNSKISFPSQCTKAVSSNKWFWGLDANGDTQAAWSYADHICVATSNLEKKDLIAYLDAPKESGQNSEP